MAKRMNINEQMYRIGVMVTYTIRYHSLNPKWDHTKKTTGDHEGSNPLYVWHRDEVGKVVDIYLGPYASEKKAESEYDKFVKRYTDSPETYRNLQISRGPVEQAVWTVV